MAKKTTKKKQTQENPQHLAPKEYSDEERALLDKHQERARKKPIKIIMTQDDSGRPTMKLEDEDDSLRSARLTEATGTADDGLQSYLLQQVMTTFKGAGDEDKAKIATIANNALAILNGIQPQDELEGMLAVQMVGVHNLAMDCIARATRTDRIDFMATYMNGATKMMRTFAAQMQGLKNYRTGGQQKMTVEHVHVNEGGQAIVGTVHQGGGRENEKNCG